MGHIYIYIYIGPNSERMYELCGVLDVNVCGTNRILAYTHERGQTSSSPPTFRVHLRTSYDPREVCLIIREF